MEEMKTFECAICGKKYNDLKSRVACETKCLEEQEKMKKALAEDSKKKAKKIAQQKIDKELEVLVNQYNKITSMINQELKKMEKEGLKINRFTLLNRCNKFLDYDMVKSNAVINEIFINL